MNRRELLQALLSTGALAAAALPGAAAAALPVPAVPGAPSADAARALRAALEAELARATERLRLPDSPAPSFIQYDVLDGDVAEVFTQFGVLSDVSRKLYRQLRAEVRVGDAKLDSSNFFAFGEADGVVSRPLPAEDDVLAQRREIWLATDSAYKGCVEQYARKRALLADQKEPRPDDSSPRPPGAPLVVDEPLPPRQADVEALTARALAVSAALRRFPALEEGESAGRAWQGYRLTVSSEGVRAQRGTGFAVLRVAATARLPDGATLEDNRSWLARTVAELPPVETLVAETTAMGEALTARVGAPLEDDYLGPVLFEPEAAVELFSQLLAAELCGTPPALEDDESLLKEHRAPAARLGRRLLPEGWMVVDDATRGEGLGSYRLDMEAVPPRRVELVRDGVLVDMLMSRTPNLTRAVSTGHARSLGTERRVAIPAVVTVTPPRLLRTEALVKQALRLAAQTGRDYALVVKHVNPVALHERFDVTLTGEEAPAGLTDPLEVERVWKDGRREPVRVRSFVGMDRRVLRDVVAAAPGAGPRDRMDGPPGPSRFNIGPLGGLLVTWDVPAVLVAEVEIRGGGGGEPRLLSIPPVTKE